MYKKILILSSLIFTSLINGESIDPKVINQTKNKIIIDIREGKEYDELHIPNAIHIVQEDLMENYLEFDKTFQGKKIFLHCKTGIRSGKLVKILKAKYSNANINDIKGGIYAWKNAELKTVSKDNRIGIMRQIQIVTGFLIILSSLLVYFKNKKFIFISFFVVSGLLSAGITGFCGMAKLLMLMPWN
jgi:rhodanese-related sulfurtransferase